MSITAGKMPEGAQKVVKKTKGKKIEDSKGTIFKGVTYQLFDTNKKNRSAMSQSYTVEIRSPTRVLKFAVDYLPDVKAIRKLYRTVVSKEKK